jgi:hypothetical protein
METPGTPSPFWPSENIQATSTIIAGFMNSEGCSEKPPSSIQRVAPLALCPRKGKATMIAMAISQMKKALRLIVFTSNIETTMRITAAKAANTHWRTAKWNGSPMFIRAAAAGLAAKAMTTPMAINSATAPRIQ